MGEEHRPEEPRFTVSLRGYDRAEVEEFVAKVGGRIRKLEEERDQLHRRVSEMGGRTGHDIQGEFATVSQEVRRVLQEAWDAAEGMRSRAGEDAGRWRSDSEAEAAVTRTDAQDDAERLRSEAWNAGEALLRQVHEEAERLARQAERESLTVLAEAERESHRLLATARRQSEDELRSGRMEAERLLVDARARHDEIVETAHKEAQSAQERARALEERRRELMEELETARAAIQRLESDLDARREALRTPSDAELAGVRVLPGPTEEAATDWSDGAESVRIVPPPPREMEAEPVDADSVAAEVRRLRSAKEKEEGEEDSGFPDEQAGEVEEAAGDDVAALFAVLRDGGQPGGVAPEPASAGQERAPEPEAPRSEPARKVALRSLPGADPLDLRDRLLLPVQNRVLRSVKRQLTEEQNVVLEGIRVSEGSWEADASDLESRLHGDLVILVQESFAAGHAAAVEMSGESPARPHADEDDLPYHAAEFAGDLMARLADSLAEGRDGGRSGRELSTTVSRLFRAWRTDEAERRVQQASLRAYHRGLARSLAGEEPWAMVWHVAGRGCPDCRAAAEAGPVAADEILMGAIAFPPAHPGCRCTLAPVPR